MNKTILVVTPHPAKDYLFWPEQNKYQICDGGKGVNVQRALTLMGVSPQHLSLKQDQPRGNITIYKKGRRPERFMGVGSAPTAKQINQFKKEFRIKVKMAQMVLLCGSAAPQSKDLFSWMVQAAQKLKVPFWVDTSQPTLALSIRQKPQLIKPNLKELEEFKGEPLKTRRKQIKAMQSIMRRGVETVVVTLGAEGAILCKNNEIWYAKAPQIKPVSELGCGDVFLASLCHAFIRKQSTEEALKGALALSAASACTLIPGQYSKTHSMSLKRKINVQKLK